jgi:hypothetical protein
MKRRFSLTRSLAILCLAVCAMPSGQAQEAASGSAAAHAVPASLRGAWLGEEVNARGRDWVAVIVHDDGQVEWYDDLPTKELPSGTGGGKHTQVDAISDGHLAFSYQAKPRNNVRLRTPTVTSQVVLDLQDGRLVGHREFPLDQDRAMTLTRVAPEH